MKPIMRTILLGGLLMLALSGIASASASAALPELVNSEGNALVKNHFTGSGGKTDITIAGWGAVDCEETSSSAGQVTGLKALHEGLNWKDCGLACKTSGAKNKEISMPEVTGELVYRVEGGLDTGAAVVFSLPKEVKIECGTTATLYVKGSWLVAVSAGTLQAQLELEENGNEEDTVREYREAPGGEIKKSGLYTTATGTKITTNAVTGLEHIERAAFEEAFKVND